MAILSDEKRALAKKDHKCDSTTLFTSDGANSWREKYLEASDFGSSIRGQSSGSRFSGAEAAVVLANADGIRECGSCRKRFTEGFQIPEVWWKEYGRNSNGYFGCETKIDHEGTLDGINTWTRFLVKQLIKDDYRWYKTNVFIQWLSNPRQTVIVVFDYPLTLMDGMPKLLLDDLETQSVCDPFWAYCKILDEVSRQQDRAVWEIRNRVRMIEKGRILRKESGLPVVDYIRLHDLARHAIHVSETLDLAVKTSQRILEHHTAYKSDMAFTPKTKVTARNVYESLHFFEHILDSLRHRAASNTARLQNEIQLTFHLSAEDGVGTSVDIARATQSDSRDMKTVAFLTMAFLPATFVSAVFSMEFFGSDVETGRLTVLKDFWIYWAVAGGATAVTIIWYCWKQGGVGGFRFESEDWVWR